MTIEDVDLDELKEARVRLVDSIKDSLNREDKEFLFAFKRGNPDWTYFPETHIKDLPAVKWKQDIGIDIFTCLTGAFTHFLYRDLIKESWRCTKKIYETRT